MPGTGSLVISPRYAQALRSAPVLNVIAAAEVWNGETWLATLALEASTTLTVSRSNLVRRSASVSMTDPLAGTSQALVPSRANDLIAPYGNELVLYSGLQYADGTRELIQQCVCGTEDVQIQNVHGDLQITLNASDRAQAVSRAGFTTNYVIAPSTDLGSAIKALIASRSLGFTPTFRFVDTTGAFTQGAPLVYVPSDDPWIKANELAASGGYELYPDQAGVFVLLPAPDPTTQATSWRYDENSSQLATDMLRTLSRVHAPNYIRRVGSGTGITVPIVGIAQDLNPQSPTYVGGKYGVVVDSKTSPLYATQGAADAAALADLKLSLGSIESFAVKAIPKPDHDVDDVIEATRAVEGLSGARYVMDGFTLGFGVAGILAFTGRQVTAAA